MGEAEFSTAILVSCHRSNGLAENAACEIIHRHSLCSVLQVSIVFCNCPTWRRKGDGKGLLPLNLKRDTSSC